MTFHYDLTSYIKKGENVITVRVDNSLQPNTRWYSGSGIYRHVWLNIANPLHIAQWGTYITTPVADSSTATVSVKTKIQNRNTSVKEGVIRSVILDEKGNQVAQSESPFSVNASGES